MLKKLFSLILVVLICCFTSCSTSTTLSSPSEHSPAEENDVPGGNEEPSITDSTSASSETVTEESKPLIDPEYLMTITVDPDYLEWLMGIPDEIKSASTVEVLKYFLDSAYMLDQIGITSSSLTAVREEDFSCHEAFRELISREDLVEALESYAGSILYGSENDVFDRAAFEKLLAQPSIKSIISGRLSTTDGYPNLRSIYTES